MEDTKKAKKKLDEKLISVISSYLSTRMDSCPRTFAHAGRLIDIGEDSIEVLSGAIGEGAATELVSFLRICKSLPNIDNLI